MNGAVFFQSLKQLWGLVVLEHRYKGNFPDISDYRCDIKYSLPFHGRWVAVNGGAVQETSHSWEVPTQRYAYDFIILDEHGKSCRGDETSPSAFYCYGQDILAPADGKIAEVGNGHPDSVITPERSVSCVAKDIRGNYILIQHSEKEYSVLAHLKPGSIVVSEGDLIRRGEKIAECGNSGNSTEPHLHFHLQAGRSFYSSPGIPVEFEHIVVAPAPNYQCFDDREISEEHRNAYPPYITRGQEVCND